MAMKIIYIDALFFIDLAADYVLCLAAARVCGLRLKRRRYLLASLLGAAYSAAVFLPGLGFLSRPVFKLAAGLLMGLTAFGAERRPFRCAGVLLAMSAAFGGVLWALSLCSGGGLENGISLSVRDLLLSFAICYAALSLLLRFKGKAAAKSKAEVRAVFLGRETRFTALVDTGNSLTDPATGAPVMLACAHALKPLFMENAALLSALSPVELLEFCAALPELRGRFRLVPYSAVGTSGLLPAFRPEELFIDEREDKELLIALSESAAGDGFEGIL